MPGRSTYVLQLLGLAQLLQDVAAERRWLRGSGRPLAEDSSSDGDGMGMTLMRLLDVVLGIYGMNGWVCGFKRGLIRDDPFGPCHGISH